jgi:hypothetical protein
MTESDPTATWASLPAAHDLNSPKALCQFASFLPAGCREIAANAG